MATGLQAEIDQQLFDRIAKKYAAKDIWPVSSHARRHRLLQTLRAIPFDREMSILEVGCGAGFSAKYLNGICDRIHGVDYSAELIQHAQRHNARKGVTFQVSDIGNYQCEQAFDMVLMIGVLHHFEDIPGTLSHISTLVKPGGWIVANEPQPGNPLVHLARNFRKRIDRNYSSDQCELSSAELIELYEGTGLQNVRVRPQGITSTPFAEVMLRPAAFFYPLSVFSCELDRLCETMLGRALRKISWNLIIAGQRPH